MVLDFIYAGQIEITAENVVDIVGAASGMELIALEEKCVEFWEANLALENCVEIFLNADKYRLMNLRAKALRTICDNFEDVTIDDLLQIDEKNFYEVLKNDQIAAAETIIFDRLVQWINCNKTDSGGDISELLNLIRLKHIPNTVCTRISCSLFVTFQRSFI